MEEGHGLRNIVRGFGRIHDQRSRVAEVGGVLEESDQPVKGYVNPLGVKTLLEGVNNNFEYPMETMEVFLNCMQKFFIVLYGQP